MNDANLSDKIRNIKTEEDVISVAREVLLLEKCDPKMELIGIHFATGKIRKALTRRVEGWSVHFKLPVEEGSSPDAIRIHIYPQFGEFDIPIDL
jgi:hypothetical protein